jgi:uncharacterized damage-inducible protein DinB
VLRGHRAEPPVPVSVVPPPPERVDPPYRDGERAALEAWLELHRRTLWHKCAGLSAGQLGERSVPPSLLSLRGLVRHMTDVELGWLRRVFAGEDAEDRYETPEDPDRAFTGFASADPAEVAAEWAGYQAELDRCRAVAAAHGLDDLSARATRLSGEHMTLRWVLLHLIEEYARHNGHADLLRERIDGATGV